MAYSQTDTFESGNGNWNLTATGDDFDWTRSSGTTASAGTGPGGGYGGSTYYVYTETSSPVANSDEALLVSNVIDASSYALSINFRVHMVGMGDGSGYLALEVYDGSSWNEEWRQTGDNGATEDGTDYVYESVDLTDYTNSDFQVRFRLHVSDAGNSYQNDAALDDITISGPDRGASVSPTELDMDESSVTLSGSGFGASQGTGTVYLSDQTTTGSFYEVDIGNAISTWSDTSISLDLTDLTSSDLAQLHELGPGARYFIVETNGAASEIPSEEITLHRPEAFVMSLSSNFAPGSTTAQLTAPATKTTGDMDGGRIEEAANPSATTTDVTTDDYREDEWCFKQKTLARMVTYEFRATIGGTEYTTYTQSPALQLTEESDAKVRVVPFATTTGTGTIDVTDADFGTAKYALVFVSWADGLDAVDDAVRMSIGATDGTDSYANSIAVNDNAASDNIAYKYQTTSYVGYLGNGTGTAQLLIEFDSWITNGIRLDVTQNSSSRVHRGFVVLFGGSDFTFSIDAVSMNTSNTVNVTAPGFEPEALILSSPNTNVSAAASATITFGGAVNVGIADATSRLNPQAGTRHTSQDTATPTNIRTWIDHQDIGGTVPPASAAVRISAVDFDSSGYSLDPGGGVGTNVQNVTAINSGGKVSFAIAHFTNPTSNSVDWEVTDGSVTPQCVIGVMTAAPNLDAANAAQDQHAKTFFAFDKDGNQACIGFAEDDNQSTSNTCSFASTNNAIWMRNDGQSGDVYLLGDPTIIPGGFKFPASEITTANSTTRYGFAIIIGDVITPTAIERTASVTCTGSVSATGHIEQPRTATVSATGTVTATSVREVSRTAGVIAAGTVSATAQREVPRTSTVTATATVTAVGIKEGFTLRTASVSATGTVTASRVIERARTSSVTTTAIVSASATREVPRTAGVIAAGTATTLRTIEKPRTASVVATAEVTAAGEVSGTINRTATVVATGTVSAIAYSEKPRTATVTATGTVLVTRVVERPATASITATGTVSAARTVERPRVVTIEAIGTVTTTRDVEKPRTASVTATGSVDATKFVERNRTASVEGAGTVTVAYQTSGGVVRTATVTAIGTVSVTRVIERPRTTSIAATGTVTAARDVEKPRDAGAIAGGTVTAARIIERGRSASVTATGSVDTAKSLETPRTASTTATGTVTATRFVERYRIASVSAIGSVDAVTSQAGVITRLAGVSATGTVTTARGVERLRVASVIANGDVTVARTREVPRTGSITAEGTVTALRSFAFLRSGSTQAIGSVDVAYFLGEPSAISEIIVGRQMIAKSNDTAFPIEAAVSEGGGVTGLSITISMRDSNSPTYYLDFNDNTMKSSGWTSKTKTLSEYGGGFYGTTIDVSTIIGLSKNHLGIEYDISGASVGITTSLLSIEDYGLSPSENLQLGEMYQRLNLDTDADMTHSPDGGISGGDIEITTTTDVDDNVITHRE